MIIELSWRKTKKEIIDRYCRLIWWFKAEKYKRIPCILRGHKWEYWNLLGAYKCEKCGEARSLVEGDGGKREWSPEYYRSGQFKKGSEWESAIKMRKTLKGGGVGYFKENGERVA